MKHIVKKYVMATKVGEAVADVIGKAPVDDKALTDISEANMDSHYALALTKDNHIVQTFKYLNGGKVYLIPEPDPVTMYFDTARHFYKTIGKNKVELFSKSSTPGYNFISVDGDFYRYFSTACSYAIFLFLSVEAFINKSIPSGFEYRRQIQDKKIELYDKLQIQRNIEFLEKIKDVLPRVTGKNFVREFTHKYELIKKLKEFRDEVVHTKSFEGVTSPNFYQDLYVMSIDFEFDKTLLAVRDFINYYQENLIEECNCGIDD